MDIGLRLNKEMLVLSGSIRDRLATLGIDSAQDLTIANILEPEMIKDALSFYVSAGSHCLLANTKDMLRAKLSKLNLDDRIDELSLSALKIANSCKAQHVIVELGNCGLPLDDNSKNSLNEFKNQYVEAGRVFNKFDGKKSTSFDAYMLSDLENVSQLKCALMGLRQVSDKPIFVNTLVNADGKINAKENIYDYAQTLIEFGATIAGIKVKDDISTAQKLCKRLRAGCDLPILLDFCVDGDNSPYNIADSMQAACIAANNAGAQFLRASGAARPSHTAVLAGMCVNMPLKLKVEV